MIYYTNVGGERTEWLASQFGVGVSSDVEWVESWCSGRVGHMVWLYRGWCLNEERIQWKINLWSLDPEGSATVFLQNIEGYPSTQNRVPEDLILQLHCSEDLEYESYSCSD
jgi:hypothetical protein